MEYNYIELGNFINSAKTGGDAIKKTPIVDYETDIRCLRIGDISNKRPYSKWGYSLVEEKYKNQYLLKKNDILIARTGNTIGVGTIIKNDINSVFNNGLIRLIINEKGNPYYIYYLITSTNFKNFIYSISGGTSTQPNIKIKHLLKYMVPDLPLSKQKQFANYLLNIDKKIDLNQHIIANLEELSQTLFKRWFVDFEFPDENGNPYKSSGGDMVESELGVIPKDWSIQTLNDISESYNTKRKPLSKLEREKVASIYPYYGATKIIDYVDDYLFDGKFILVGEDGTVQTEEGHPFVQYVWGQFWVSNHAHILKGKNLSDEVLMLILNNIDIQPYITGAVQPKISKKNLNSIKIVVGSKLIYGKFDQYINTYYKKIREVHDENKYLTQLRDTLLPKLMSGEIEIPDDIEVNEDELSI
ncbi:restriction endonuclease subunit S [Staphylococcus cohnii]|uniref:restriction endonuclease subunit S n=1 Tax=Staphylococcus cohnii TaxID=29382 RepID=UPI000CD096E4|nr:restriction endonuclease subunit S [Staphylococcus cohnii]AYX91061.1 restriction endonuclease subunit S [Staphylococcus cohnii]PNZ43482.1 restriction endonuclease subunit S [Staphylococcus cohnii subsp. cohnii]GEP87595.1 type I restriction modification system subunit S [Staphylococcus cohnii subsp. cohnii]SUM05512.1 type I restriction-modification system specificity protein [Staphylococcus cohnii]